MSKIRKVGSNRESIRERNITEYTDKELVSILNLDPCNKKALLELTNRASNKLKA